jgi:hypothetical protein
MVSDGSLFKPVTEGGLGVPPELFRSSGYLTDGGGLPAAEYQAQVAAEEAANAREGGAAIAVQAAEVAAVQAEAASLSSSLAAPQLQDGRGQCLLGAGRTRVPFTARLEAAEQEVDAEVGEGVAQTPAAAQELEAAELGGSKESKKSSSKHSSRKSQELVAMSSMCAALFQDGVPASAVYTLAHQGVTLEVLKRFPVAWAVECLEEKWVTLNPRELQQLAMVTHAHGNVPLSMQTSPQRGKEQAPHEPDTVVEPGVKPFFFFACGTAGCNCKAAWNGAPGEACSKRCRDSPFEVPAGRVGK